MKSIGFDYTKWVDFYTRDAGLRSTPYERLNLAWRPTVASRGDKNILHVTRGPRVFCCPLWGRQQ